MFAQLAPNPPTNRLPWFDFARGFAMLTIVVFHALQPVVTQAWSPLISAGGAGVHVFVFCSGFGLARSSSRLSWQAFFRRRFVRILIPYYVFVTAIFLLNQLTQTYPHDGWRAYLSHVLLFKMFDESLIGSFGEHLWFISTIIQLYLMFPLLIASLNRWGDWPTFWMSVVVSTIFSLWLIANGLTELRVYASSAPVFLWEFVLGMVAARTYPTSADRVDRIPSVLWLLIVSVVGSLHLAAARELGPRWFGLDNVCAIAAYGGTTILLYRMAKAQPRTRLLTAMIGLSQFSYELYLVHGVIVTRLFRRLEPTSWAALLVTCTIAVALSIVAGWLYHQLLQAIFKSR